MVLLFFGASTLQHCSDPGESAVPEKVQFTWSLSDTDSKNGRSKIDRVPDALIVTVAKASGETLLENYRINLIRAGDAFISEPLSLTPGRYNITQFMLVAGENELLYAAPVKGAPLAPAVNHPLPFLINILQGRVNRFDVEVLKFTEANFPEEFGYTSFTINDVNPLKISPFLAGENGLAFTTATAYVIEGEDTIKTQPLAARINLFSFRGEDRNTVRKLVVAKPGYATYIKEFRYIDFINQLEGFPLEIIFKPAVFTCTPFFLNEDPDNMLFKMTLNGPSGNLAVNWGDGASETYVLSSEGVTLEHQYVTPGNFQMTMSGDVDKIEVLKAFYGWGAMSAANFQGLTALREIRMGYTHGPSVVDFSNNIGLEYVMMPVVNELKKLILPKNTVLHYLELTGPNQMTPADVDYVIDQVFNGAVANHTQDGILLLGRMYNDTDHMLGPPSPDRLAKLRVLITEYGWHSQPGPL
jgi:hypothetical protein